jgi:putative PIN family toxin of toxin-antitoxin system
VRAVLDTIVLVSALFWHGPPHELLDRVRRGDLRLISSPALMDELARVVARPKFAAILTASRSDRHRAVAEIGDLAEVIEPTALPERICRDPDDDAILALAVAANVDLIVSGDQDLLLLGNFRGIAIVQPAEVLRRLARDGNDAKG